MVTPIKMMMSDVLAIKKHLRTTKMNVFDKRQRAEFNVHLMQFFLSGTKTKPIGISLDATHWYYLS